MDGINWYVYCNGNPIPFIDPSGKMLESDGQYSSYVQRQLLEYTIKYVLAKSRGDEKTANEASMGAAELRSNSQAQPLWQRAVYDAEAHFR